MSARITFSISPSRAGRIHHVDEEDLRIVLSRLPEEVWHRLKAVHLNDQSRGVRVLGYVNQGRREITLCALPQHIGLTRAIRKAGTPEQFGARWGQKWPNLAIRRFMLYHVFLHELGHLQLIDENRRSVRLKFAHEKLAESFAIQWRNRLWAEPFRNPDPVHNPPTAKEFESLSVRDEGD
jgi:hypothetical protein